MKGKILVLFFCFSLSSLSLFGLEDVASIIRGYPMYDELEKNQIVSKQFIQYMEWMSDKAPDGKLVFDLMKGNARSLEAISTIFHEKVEFNEWLNLGHRFEDIMTIDYYQKHYMEVYPIAHRRALIEELNLIKYFAQKRGLKNLPEIAYSFVSPLIERYNVPVLKSQNRLKFNWEYQPQIQFLSEDDIKNAIEVYEVGGYTFKDKNRILSEALSIISNSKK